MNIYKKRNLVLKIPNLEENLNLLISEFLTKNSDNQIWYQIFRKRKENYI